MSKMPPVHPGEVLKEDAMAPIGLSANRLAADAGIPTSRVLEIIKGRRSITADTALRLGRYFGTSAALWMNLQTRYDLELAQARIGKSIEKTIRPCEVVRG
jgi:addiction module HigA family antidote